MIWKRQPPCKAPTGWHAKHGGAPASHTAYGLYDAKMTQIFSALAPGCKFIFWDWFSRDLQNASI